MNEANKNKWKEIGESQLLCKYEICVRMRNENSDYLFSEIYARQWSKLGAELGAPLQNFKYLNVERSISDFENSWLFAGWDSVSFLLFHYR